MSTNLQEITHGFCFNCTTVLCREYDQSNKGVSFFGTFFEKIEIVAQIGAKSNARHRRNPKILYIQLNSSRRHVPYSWLKESRVKFKAKQFKVFFDGPRRMSLKKFTRNQRKKSSKTKVLDFDPRIQCKIARRRRHRTNGGRQRFHTKYDTDRRTDSNERVGRIPYFFEFAVTMGRGVKREQ